MVPDSDAPSRNRPLVLFGSASFATVIAGAAAIFLSGIGTLQALANLAAWLAGAILAFGMYKFGKAHLFRLAIIALTLLALAATLFGDGLDGVRRWISLGPVNANAAALLLPASIVALATSRMKEHFAAALWLALLLLIVAQPDASQATGLAIAGCIIAWRWHTSLRFVCAGLFVILAAYAWFRPDPLVSVVSVEGIVGLSCAVSPLLAGALVTALAATLVSFLILHKARSSRTASDALFGYASAISVSAAIGNFPVPLAGFGITFPIGWWLAVGLLLSARD